MGSAGGGVEGWGEKAYNCNWITIKIKKKKKKRMAPEHRPCPSTRELIYNKMWV